MNVIDNLRKSIIEKIATISSEESLYEIYQLIEKIADKDKVILTNDQIAMVEQSEDDIKSGRVFSQKDLDKDDLNWLNDT
ncbi:MAG TPA: hypothetical protein VIM07_00565 [Chitinophagaceae bacterium]